MKQNFIHPALAYVLPALAVLALPLTAHAAPPAACAHISHDSVQDSAQGASYTGLVVSTGDGRSTLHAAHMQFAAPAGSSPDSVHAMAEAASLLLLSSVTGQHNAACSSWLSEQGTAAQAILASGKSLGMSWKSASIVVGAAQVSVGTAQLQLQGRTGTGRSAATLNLGGLHYHNVANQGLLPTQAHAAFSVPVNELPALLAAIGGRSTAAPAVHVDIAELRAAQKDSVLSGHGQATLTGDVSATSASGHLEISNLEGLISTARAEGQIKLATALVLARLVSHRSGNANTWDTSWSSGVLTVNGFPLPIK